MCLCVCGTYVNIDMYNIYVIFHDIICFFQHFSALRTLVEKITIRLILSILYRHIYAIHIYYYDIEPTHFQNNIATE